LNKEQSIETTCPLKTIETTSVATGDSVTNNLGPTCRLRKSCDI
jgi:hypothetical protein